MIEALSLCQASSADPYLNLALEEALLKTVKRGELILYLWQNEKTVVIGRNQNAYAQCRIQALAQDGGRLARRLSGGGAVYHDLGNLNFTFLTHSENYDVRRQLSVLCAAVGRFHIKAELSGRNDILAQGRKFSGNAFYRLGDRRYHHGTLLVSVDAEQMGKYLTPDIVKLQSKGVDSVRSRVVNLQTLCPGMRVEALKSAVAEAFQAVYGLRANEISGPDGGALLKARERFASFDWLFGNEREFTYQSDTARFFFGCAKLCLKVSGGLISDAVLFTDAMETALSEVVRRALLGVPFSPGAAKAALDAAAIRHKNMAEALRAVASLVIIE